MRRQWSTLRQPGLEGHERSMELASALAQICDPETLEAFLHTKMLLDRIGGQVYIAPYRNKYDAGTGERLEDQRQPGVYQTDGYLFHYDHLAKLTKAPREPDARPDEPLPNPAEGQLTEEEFQLALVEEEPETAA